MFPHPNVEILGTTYFQVQKNCMENDGLACFECPKLEGVTSHDSDVHRNYTQDTTTLTRPSFDR